MQNGLRKILGIISLSLLLCPLSHAQTSTYRLKTADSLFRASRFTQSMEQYRAILANNEYTPAMLLRMAYIQEGLANTGQALYYLNLYHNITQDPAALRKMEELAKKFNLAGYETTDSSRLLSWYRENHQSISIALAATIILLMAIAIRIRLRAHQRPIGTAITIFATAALLFAHLNFGLQSQPGIVATNNTYVMAGPSAAADVVERIGEGHRVEVIGKKDVWLKVLWDGKETYVKKNNVLVVRL